MNDDSMLAAIAHRLRPTLSIATASIALAACGNLTAGGFGEVHTYVSGDDPEPSPQPSATSGAAPAAIDPLLGTIDVAFSAYLRADDGTGFQLGSDQLFGKVAIDGSDEQLLKIQVTPEDRYTEISFYFTQVSADVVSGLPVVGEVSVDLASTLTFSRPIDLDLSEGEQVELVIDLNAPAWLATADPITQTVQAAVFAALVEVSLR
jgi:hypothetical protein